MDLSQVVTGCSSGSASSFLSFSPFPPPSVQFKGEDDNGNNGDLFFRLDQDVETVLGPDDEGEGVDVGVVECECGLEYKAEFGKVGVGKVRESKSVDGGRIGICKYIGGKRRASIHVEIVNTGKEEYGRVVTSIRHEDGAVDISYHEEVEVSKRDDQPKDLNTVQLERNKAGEVKVVSVTTNERMDKDKEATEALLPPGGIPSTKGEGGDCASPEEATGKGGSQAAGVGHLPPPPPPSQAPSHLGQKSQSVSLQMGFRITVEEQPSNVIAVIFSFNEDSGKHKVVRRANLLPGKHLHSSSLARNQPQPPAVTDTRPANGSTNSNNSTNPGSWTNLSNYKPSVMKVTKNSMGTFTV